MIIFLLIVFAIIFIMFILYNINKYKQSQNKDIKPSNIAVLANNILNYKDKIKQDVPGWFVTYSNNY